MYCKYCGEQIDDRASVCPKCGVAVAKSNSNDAPSGGFAFLCFLFPLLGLILYLVWKDDYPQKAKSCGKGAIIGVIVSIVITIVSTCALSCALASLIFLIY